VGGEQETGWTSKCSTPVLHFGPWFHVKDAVRDFHGNAFATIIELI
jgi:hypothetical protein